MDRDRTLNPRRRALSEDAPEEGPDQQSSLLEAARSWAGTARDALERLETDDAHQFLQTARRNGPGQ